MLNANAILFSVDWATLAKQWIQQKQTVGAAVVPTMQPAMTLVPMLPPTPTQVSLASAITLQQPVRYSECLSLAMQDMR